MIKVGGWPGIVEKYPLAASNKTMTDYQSYGNHTCGLPPADWKHIFRSADADLPWPAMTFGLTINALYVWCADQVMFFFIVKDTS